RRKQLSERAGRCPVARLRAICCAGSWLTWGLGCATSAWQPTLTVHKVATARASQSRSARAGASILVCSQCQPPRLLSLNPHSIQARNPYHATSTAVGGRSVRINQGSRYPASQRARRVHVSCRAGVAKQVTEPAHRCPTRLTTCVSGRKVAAEDTRYRCSGSLLES